MDNTFFMGWSRGRWEGETLVIDVTGLNDKNWLDRAGNFYSDAVHVVERLTAVSPYHLLVRGDHRGREGVFAPLENQLPALSTDGARCSADGIQVSALCRRAGLRALHEEADQLAEVW